VLVAVFGERKHAIQDEITDQKPNFLPSPMSDLVYVSVSAETRVIDPRFGKESKLVV
jgi:hypothetical protein